MVKSKNRIEYIDLVRGVGIILMITCHTGVPGIVHKVIYGFHMPLFFFISGLFYKPGRYNSLVEVLKKASKQFLLPYISFSVVQWGIWLFTDANGIFPLAPLLKCFWVNTDSTLKFAKALWFLTAMFWVQPIYYCLSTYIKNNCMRSVTVCLIGIGGVLVNFLPFVLPLSIGQSFMGVVLYHIAVLMKEENIYERILNQKSIVIILEVSISLFIILINGSISMKSCTYSNVALFLMGAVGGTVSCLCLSKKMVGSATKHLRFISLPISYVEWIGRFSLSYLGLNEAMIRISQIILASLTLNDVLMRILTLVLSLMLCGILDITIRKTPLHILFGK